MELQTLVNEYTSIGFGESLYQESLHIVRTVSRHYPVSYSPTGLWDEDAFTALAHDWVTTKIWRLGQLEHLFAANRMLSEFRNGLIYSFRKFLISQKKRTALDNLFQRANVLLENDPRFRLFKDNKKKAFRLWGLIAWHDSQPESGDEAELISAGIQLKNFSVIRYRDDAKKTSPILADTDLLVFLLSLLELVGYPLTLAQFVLVLQYRFNLLEVDEIRLETFLAEDSEGNPFRVCDVISENVTGEEIVIVDESTMTILEKLSPRQKQALLAYALPKATLTGIAKELGCSKSTVENEIQRALEIIHRNTETLSEAEAIFARLLELLSPSPN